MFIKILTLSFIFSNALGEVGLQKAGALIKEPFNLHKQSNDVVPSGITDQLEAACKFKYFTWE